MCLAWFVCGYLFVWYFVQLHSYIYLTIAKCFFGPSYMYFDVRLQMVHPPVYPHYPHDLVLCSNHLCGQWEGKWIYETYTHLNTVLQLECETSLTLVSNSSWTKPLSLYLFTIWYFYHWPTMIRQKAKFQNIFARFAVHDETRTPDKSGYTSLVSVLTPEKTCTWFCVSCCVK